MRVVTLDTNCLIDLEQRSPNATFIRALMSRHVSGSIALCLPAIAASENQRGGGVLGNFAEFQARVEGAGLGGVRLIEPIAYMDVTYFDFCLMADDEMVDLERRIHGILHPGIEFDYALYCSSRGLDAGATPTDRRWRNAKCDVLVAWSHIHHNGNVLVTADENFHQASKRAALVALGAGAIARPRDAASVV